MSLIIWWFSWWIWSDTWCSDWWISSSIWRQWACSHHWWVKNSINEIWYTILLFSIIINIISFIIYTKNEDKRKEEENKRIIEEKKLREELDKKKAEEYIKEYNFIKCNKEIIIKAKEERKKIWFFYTNNNWVKSYREFLPKTINNTYLTTSWHCFSSNEKRVFSIKKMFL